MTKIETSLKDCFIFEPKVFGDHRGYFYESYNHKIFCEAIGKNPNEINFVQDNQSMSKYGILRGLHFQTQNAQGKLVRVTQGAVYDVAVDLRKSSPTFGQSFGVELSAENFKQLWIPAGFAHGFLVLTETAIFNYKTTDYYAPQFEKSLLWNDPALKINWPKISVEPLLKDLDKNGTPLKECFYYE